jgi:hypothetical protein
MPTINRASERERDVSRKREKVRSEKLIVIPPCQNRARREELEADDIRWLMFYFGVDSEVRDPFWYEFTAQQRQMIEDFRNAIVYGGDQAEAASRGEGKSTLLERLITKYTLAGLLSYSVLFQATGALADNSLDSIKTAIEENPLLAADYPEVCFPVQALENTPNRAHYQLANGHRHDNGEPFEMASTRFTWCGQEIIFPKVPGSPSSGSIIATRGLDSAVRGLKKRGRRPQLAAIDDPDTEETSRSEEQATKLEDRIDKAIGGLGSQQRPIARIMLCTIPSRISVAYKFTDPQQKPSWKGRRFRFLISPPERIDLWDEYVQIRMDEFRSFAAGETDDKHCRNSHQFYLDRREQMDAGAEVANPNRFDGRELPDGSQIEVSTLQSYYNAVARLGPEAVATEYDNDPPEEFSSLGTTLTAGMVQKRLSGYARRIVPYDCVALTQGIDVKKEGLHWVVKAWKEDCTNYVVDYGFFETHGTVYGSDDGIEHAIRRAILGRMEQANAEPCTTLDGTVVPIRMSLIDSGWKPSAVYHACLDIGLGVFPAKGHGKSHGCATINFSAAQRQTDVIRPGDRWRQDWQQISSTRGVWLTNCDADHWKSFEHSRWMTAEGKPGAAYVFGQMTDEERRNINKRVPREVKEHFSFAKHLTAETEGEEMVRGVIKRVWRTKPGRVQNHYLDSCYLSGVAASIVGIRLLPMPIQPEPKKRPLVVSTSQSNQSRW